MLKPKDHFHGSDLEKIEEIYGIAKEDIISFGANVNPLGLSEKLRTGLSAHLDALTGYPDREYTSLRKTIADYCHTDYRNVIVGNGSTELISLSIAIKHPKHAIILAPTYSEYEREISLNGGQYTYYELTEETNFQLNCEHFLSCLNDTIDLLVICNPNNPTSTSLSAETIRKILEHCKKTDTFVVIDETYIEFVTDYEETTAIPLTKEYDNFLVLRGISKFFACPGLRLGYAVCGNSDLLAIIEERKNPWTINSLAEVAGKLMFTDTDYIKATTSLISEERERVANALRSVRGLKVYEPTANFVLVQITLPSLTADDLFEACIKRGCMIRNCSTFPFLNNQYFRICFMNPKENDILLDCIQKTVQDALS